MWERGTKPPILKQQTMLNLYPSSKLKKHILDDTPIHFNDLESDMLFAKDDALLDSGVYIHSIKEAEFGKEDIIHNYLRRKLEICFTANKELVKTMKKQDEEKEPKHKGKTQRELDRLKELLELAEKEIKPLPRQSFKCFRRRSGSSLTKPPDIVNVIRSEKEPRENDEILVSNGCLKLSPSPRQRSYANAKRYFEYRKEGLTQTKAIAMANRIRCNENKYKKKDINQEEALGKKEITQSLERKITESILLAKKDHMTKTFGNYVDLYKYERPELTGRISKIFNHEISEINAQLFTPKTIPRTKSNLAPFKTMYTESPPRAQRTLSVFNRTKMEHKPIFRKSYGGDRKTELIHNNHKFRERLERRIEAKMKEADENREAFLSRRIQRVKINHQERLEEIRKKQDQDMETFWEKYRFKNRPKPIQTSMSKSPSRKPREL